VCAQKGYPLVIVMAENFSLERRKLLRFLGAKVILTPASERGTGMFRTAERLAEAHGWFFSRQFENEANAEFHARTTAQEILGDFENLALDYWVTGFGTGGTLKGVAGQLKQHRPDTRVVLAEPDNAQLIASGVPQVRRPDGAAARSHPGARAHPVQGWTPDFIPKLAGDAHAAGLIDIFQPVSGAKALQVAQDLARREGIFCGISGGATVAAAIALAENAPDGSALLAMVPDTGERYLSTPLFDHIKDEMDDEEMAVAESARALAVVSPPPLAQKTPVLPISEEALEFVKEVISSDSDPVVMFGFEWCEFCWSVRRLFAVAGVPFRSIDVDGAEMREGDRGGDVLRALFAHTGMRTVPQVFIGGTLVGGADDVLAAAGDGTLSQNLKQLAKPIEFAPVGDPMDYLPKWVRRPSRATSAAQAGA
ncbi:MAG: pyridoxal-phosphate dependent enzyme, partial [Pseudomonadota bacterium]